jgi:phosphate-selective porin OprO/OprP
MIVNALSPNEDIGVMVFGNLFGGRIVYALGYFNGQGRNAEATNGEKEYIGRIVVAPFHGYESVLLKNLYFGGSLGTSNLKKDYSDADIKTQGGTKFFDILENVELNGRLTRGGAELEYLAGPFSLKMECLRGILDRLTGADAHGSLVMYGYYATAGVMLTGESVAQNASIRPKKNFDPLTGGCGALQLVVRYQAFFTDRELINRGLAGGVTDARSTGAGINWYPNYHIRFQFSYDYVWFGSSLTIENVSIKHENTLVLRVQFDF